MSDPFKLGGGSRLWLPQPEKLILRNFSLYDNAPVIEASFSDGVFCLAGANGLGKSTFLAALNYAVTGIVADPNRKFESVQEYYRKSQPYSSEFFRGRIDEGDAEAAQVEIEMRVGSSRYRLVRGMFDPTGLRELSIVREGLSDGEVFDAAGLDDASRHRAYADAIARDVGLDTFAQLVFLQHFVLTFDERRHLLFWDERVAQAALYIAFGVDAEKAERADNLRRSAEKADSLARNLQWQATDMRKRLKDVEEALAQQQPSTTDIAQDHRALLDDREELVQRLDLLEDEYSDVRLRLADRRARLNAASSDYETQFMAHVTGRFPVDRHPIVVSALERHRCGLCGTEGEPVATTVRSRIKGGECPFCASTLGAVDPNSADRLVEHERQLAALEDEVRDAEATSARLEGLIATERVRAEELATTLGSLERDNEALLLTSTALGSVTANATDHFRAQIAELMDRKRTQLDKRNTARAELRTLQDELTLAYAEAEENFVPLFTSLAREFLGLDLDIALQTQAGGVHLLLTVQGAARRVQDSLSESQRFFVDIALRMALAQRMSASGASCLFIDTPEGSLDIAYESRAGSMFGQFVMSGHQMVMTANINTSQLLRKLAATCGSDRMTLMRMTEWTSLSEVQSAEEELFDRAYEEIEDALEAGG